MTMHCRHHLTCTITCPHHDPHEHNKFCDRDGLKATCSGGDDPYCVPVSKQEALLTLMAAHFPKEAVAGIVEDVMRIFGEAA